MRQMQSPSTLGTIAAPITPPGVGGVSVIRVSGPEAMVIAAALFRGTDIATAPGNTIHYGRLVDRQEKEIDDVLLSIFREPHSYTGEDVIEINCHGNPIIVNTVLELIVGLGARIANPGEFTKRAFLNGRIDLTQAEAVADLIFASSEVAIDTARRQLHGELGIKITDVINRLIHSCGLIELELDFVEEGIIIAEEDLVRKALIESKSELEKLLSTYRHGRLYAHGLKVAITGKPNVGKSSLLNRFAGEERAIVSPIPGTTRDPINIAILHKGFRVEFWDTAGVRPSKDSIELIGIEKSIEYAARADVVLYLIDGSSPTTEGNADHELILLKKSISESSKLLTILNKCDLGLNAEILETTLKNGPFCTISAKTGFGINELLSQILEISMPAENSFTECIALTNQRHYDCISRASHSLSKAIIAEEVDSGEFVALEIRSAIDNLGEIVGMVTPEQILNTIFTNFCIGK